MLFHHKSASPYFPDVQVVSTIPVNSKFTKASLAVVPQVTLGSCSSRSHFLLVGRQLTQKIGSFAQFSNISFLVPEWTLSSLKDTFDSRMKQLYFKYKISKSSSSLVQPIDHLIRIRSWNSRGSIQPGRQVKM